MTIEYSEVLETLAGVSVTLAGFIGVVVVFQKSSVKADQNAKYHLLLSSLSVLGLALLPLILQPIVQDSLTIWRICNPLMGGVHLLGASRGIFDSRKGESKIPVLLFAPVSFLLFGGSIAIALGFFSAYASFVYFFGLTWSLAVASVAFASLVSQDGT